MSLRKYQSVEATKVLPPKEQEKIAGNLHKLGKTSARDLTAEQRQQAFDANRIT